MSGFARCVHGCISLPLMYLCFMKPLPWCFRERVPQGWVPRAGRAHTLSLTGHHRCLLAPWQIPSPVKLLVLHPGRGTVAWSPAECGQAMGVGLPCSHAHQGDTGNGAFGPGLQLSWAQAPCPAEEP